MSEHNVSNSSLFRYFGAKDWSIFGLIFNREKKSPGYHREAKEISPAEAEKFKSLVAITEASFSSNPDKLEGFPTLELLKPEFSNLPNNVKAKEKCLLDTNTGLKVTIIKDKNTTYVAFGCIYSANSELSIKKEQTAVVRRQYQAAVRNVAGFEAKLFNQAEEVFLKIKDQHDNIKLVGGCLGGAIASYVGLRQDVPTTTINGFPLGVKLQQKIGRDKLAKADNLIAHLIVKGDQFSDHRILNIFDRFLSFIGIRTPGNFGMRYTIPSMFKTAKETHELVMRSLKKYCEGINAR